MPEEKERPRPHGDKLAHPEQTARDPEDNRAQAQSDATHDAARAAATDDGMRVETDRDDGLGSTANGVPEFDDDAAEQRKRQYQNGAGLVSGID